MWELQIILWYGQENQQAKAKKSRRGGKLYKWRIDKLEMAEKRQEEFQEKMVKNAVKVSE